MHLLTACFASIRHLHSETGHKELSFESDVSAVGSVKQNVSWQECNKALRPVIILCLFLTVCVGLQCVILAFPGCTHFHFKLTFSIQFLKVMQQAQLMSIVICMDSKRISDYESDKEIERARLQLTNTILVILVKLYKMTCYQSSRKREYLFLQYNAFNFSQTF